MCCVWFQGGETSRARRVEPAQVSQAQARQEDARQGEAREKERERECEGETARQAKLG